MYLVAIAWLYVVVLMAIAEGVSDHGSWLGAAVTLTFYGLLPLGVALYLIGTPARRAARQRQSIPATDVAPDGGDHAAAAAITAKREEP